jgi:hypothetical protein
MEQGKLFFLRQRQEEIPLAVQHLNLIVIHARFL